MTAYDSIMQGLNEAVAFAQGKDVGAKVHHVDVPVERRAKLTPLAG